MNELPEVAVNFALTWDMRITTRRRTRADFSSPRDKYRLQAIRAGADAVLAGRGTVEIERMRMGVPDETLRASRRQRGLPEEPLRVVVSNSGRLDPDWPLFAEKGAPVFVFSTEAMSGEIRSALAARAAVHLDKERVNLRGMLQALRARHNVRRVVCEGGAGLLRSLLEERLVDELNLTFCPRIFGGEEAPTLTGIGGDFLRADCKLESLQVEGDEAFARYRVQTL